MRSWQKDYSRYVPLFRENILLFSGVALMLVAAMMMIATLVA